MRGIALASVEDRDLAAVVGRMAEQAVRIKRCKGGVGQIRGAGQAADRLPSVRKRPRVWSHDRLCELEALLARGFTYGQIAHRMNLRRSQIGNAVHRYKLGK